jgi:hypothetical protein
MSSKKKYESKETKQELKAQVLLEDIEIKEEIKKVSEPEIQKFHCAEAAEKLIIGYQERWLPSIKSFAEHHAMTSNHSLEEWKKLFTLWGAKVK